MKHIQLTKGLVAIVDDEDYERLSAHKWHVSDKYAARGARNALMHREIINPPPGMVVDHINGDTLDNRRANLRVCVQIKNSYNARRSVANKSGYKGVSMHMGKWRAAIQANGKWMQIGRFATPEEAARAYDAAARKYHGEFAVTNFQEGSL